MFLAEQRTAIAGGVIELTVEFVLVEDSDHDFILVGVVKGFNDRVPIQAEKLGDGGIDLQDNSNMVLVLRIVCFEVEQGHLTLLFVQIQVVGCGLLFQVVVCDQQFFIQRTSLLALLHRVKSSLDKGVKPMLFSNSTDVWVVVIGDEELHFPMVLLIDLAHKAEEDVMLLYVEVGFRVHVLGPFVGRGQAE